MPALARPSKKRWFKPLDKALWSLSYYGDTDDDVLGEVEEWLDALTSALARVAAIKDGPDALHELLDEVAEKYDVSELLDLKDDIEKLYEYAAAFSYGVCVLPAKKFRHADDCIQNVQGTLEEFLSALS